MKRKPTLVTWNLIDTRDGSIVMEALGKQALQKKALRAGLIECERSKYFLNWYCGHYDLRPAKRPRA